MEHFKMALGILAGSLVSGMYLISSRQAGWWILAIAFISIVGWIRWDN